MSDAGHLAAQGRASAVAVAALARRRANTAGAVVLAYHDVLPDDAPSFSYAVSVKRLRQHFDVVQRMGCKPVSLRDLSARLRAGQDVTGLVAIVFDDAIVGVHQRALPELAQRGWAATLHPVVDRLGLEPPWWPGSRRTMTWRELEEVVMAGIELGGHGTTHACLPCLDDLHLAAELEGSRDRLSQLVGREVDELAYPYGHHDARVRDAARAAGYRTGWTFLNGRVVPDTDPWRLPRLTMHQGLFPAKLAQQLSRRLKDWPSASAPAVHPEHRGF